MNTVQKNNKTHLEALIAAQESFRANHSAHRTVEQSIQNLADEVSNITALSKIIGDISVQIQLLSTNASIEAARAGEAGKGFSVVAREITNLAQNSKTAVQDIDNQIREFEKLILHAIESASVANT